MRIAAICMLAPFVLSACSLRDKEPELAFSIEDGAIRNDFFRDGPVAAHVLLKSAASPRLVVAFPAGNSGVGVWFSPTSDPVRWGAPEEMTASEQKLEDGSLRRGVEFETSVSIAKIGVHKAVLSNVRVLRDYGKLGKAPESVDVAPETDGSKIVWQRRRIDGAAGYYISLDALNGSVVENKGDGALAFVASDGRPLRFRVVALTGDAPLTGVPQKSLIAERADANQRLRDVLTFLTYEEKLLAGSWQYNTYFGRDTLMSIALLGETLRPAGVEAGVSAVLDRLSASGEVAHEEDISEFALLRRQKDGAALSDEPILDYKMIDDDFMLAPVLAAYLLDRSDGQPRARDFLSRTSPSGVPYRDLVLRNLEFVVIAARPFAQSGNRQDLIRLHENIPVGEWRDSRNGLGGGAYPYNVNVALVPAALDAAGRLAASGLLGENEKLVAFADEARKLSEIWAATAPALFRVSIGQEEAAAKISKAVADLQLNEPHANPAVAGAEIEFAALSLDDKGAPIAVMNSDAGFAMLFGNPVERDLSAAADLLLRPFPAGLMTPAGMVVANAALADPALTEMFGRDRYHGAVIWSWQQAMMIAGLKKQLTRTDLTPAVREKLSSALVAIEDAVAAGRDHQAAELWTWTVADGSIRRAPFGDTAGDENESNAAQLWSTAHLVRSVD